MNRLTEEQLQAWESEAKAAITGSRNGWEDFADSAVGHVPVLVAEVRRLRAMIRSATPKIIDWEPMSYPTEEVGHETAH